MESVALTLVYIEQVRYIVFAIRRKGERLNIF